MGLNMQGIVKWYNPAKKYGFIKPDSGGGDIFVHISALEKAGMTSLNEGDKISFDIETSKGKSSAMNLELI